MNYQRKEVLQPSCFATTVGVLLPRIARNILLIDPQRNHGGDDQCKQRLYLQSNDRNLNIVGLHLETQSTHLLSLRFLQLLLDSGIVFGNCR